jgi:hypothetical protein
LNSNQLELKPGKLGKTGKLLQSKTILKRQDGKTSETTRLSARQIEHIAANCRGLPASQNRHDRCLQRAPRHVDLADCIHEDIHL